MSELTEAVEAARQAFAAATNLEELAVARREHLGDDAPISQARRALGSLPKNERKDAGRLVNQARGEAEKAYATAKTALEEKRNAEVLIAERVDVTVPTTRRQVGRCTRSRRCWRRSRIFLFPWAMRWRMVQRWRRSISISIP